MTEQMNDQIEGQISPFPSRSPKFPHHRNQAIRGP